MRENIIRAESEEMFKKVGIKLEYKYDELQKYDKQVGFWMRIKNREIIALKKRLKREKIRGLALDMDETLSFTIGYMVGELMKRLGIRKI